MEEPRSGFKPDTRPRTNKTCTGGEGNGSGAPGRCSLENANCVDLTGAADEEGPPASAWEEPVLRVVAGNPLTSYHKQILLSHGWLNDEIINSYLHTLAEARPDVYAFSTYLHPKFMSEGRPGIERWLRGLALPSRRLVLVPINLANVHWALVAFDTGKMAVAYYDSMLGGRQGAVRRLAAYARLFEGLLAEERRAAEREGGGAPHDDAVGAAAHLMAKMSLSAPEPTPGKRQVALSIPAGQPQQSDGSSCGVFVCKWAQVLAASAPASFTQADVDRHRQAILEAILGGRAGGLPGP